MTLDVFRHLRHSMRHLVLNTPLYEWRLSGSVPDRLMVRPVDPWPGNAMAGQWMCEGAFMMDGDVQPVAFSGWDTADMDDIHRTQIHGFTWLRDLRALGGRNARLQARAMIMDWAQTYHRWDERVWRPDIAGERIAMWIAHYEFFGEAEPSEDDILFNEVFFNSLIRQARHIGQSLPGEYDGIPLLKALRGLLYAGLGFEGYEDWIMQGLSLLEIAIRRQILPDGAHVSRSGADLLEALQILLDIRTALFAGAYPMPETLQHAIDRMVPALRFFRYNDKKLALFNGTQEGDEAFIDSVLAQSGSKVKALSSLPCAGYERASLGRTSLIFDCGRSPDYPYEIHAHAAPLAFEMTYGRDRVFVSCGSHPTCADWREALRATAAHTALTIDSRNACEIRADGHFSRKVRTADAVREDTKNSCLLEGTHDGYMPLFGIVHRRRLYLSDHGHDLRGEDTLASVVGCPPRGHDFAVRFHIHPRVLVSLVQDGDAALLRLPGGIGWRFQQSGGMLALEDSVYAGEGSRPRKTKQLVIYGQITDENTKIKWALQREGGLKT